MKKVTFAVIAISFGMMAAVVQAREPSGRIDTKQFAIAAGEHTVTNTAWLNVGNDELVFVEGGTREKTGVGAVRAVVVTIDSPVTNGAVAFYTYDKGVRGAALYSATAITGLTHSARYDLTANIYSGRILSIISRGSTITNVATTATCSFIVE